MIEIPGEGERIPIQTGELHFKELDLEAEEFLQVTVWQHAVDVGLRLRGPAAFELNLNGPHGIVGEEELLLITPAAGRYRIEVEASRKEEVVGHFTLETRTRRSPSSRDRELAAADAAYRGAREALKLDPVQSIESLRGSLGIFEKYGLEGREAMLVETLAEAYNRRDKVEVASAFFDQACALYERAGEKYKRAVTLNKLALNHQRLGRVGRGLGLLQESLQLFQELGGTHEQVHLMVHVGISHQRLSSLQEALEWFDRATAVAEEGGLAPTNFAKISVAKGSVYLSLNQGEEALRVYRDALEIYRRGGDERRAARTLVSLADVALRYREMKKAGEYAMEAIEVLRALEKSQTSRDLARAYLLLGRIEARQGQAVAARAAFDKALESSLEAADRSLEATLVLELGRLSHEERRFEEAVEIFEEALEIFEEIGEHTGQALAHRHLGAAWLALGSPEKAWERFAPSLGVAEEIRRQSHRLDFRAGYFAFRQDFFEVGIEISMALHAASSEADPDEKKFARQALELQERRLARTLLDTLAGKVEARREVAPDLLAEEKRLEEQLRDLAAPKALENPSEAEMKHLLGELQDVRGRILAAALPEEPVLETVKFEEMRAQLDDESQLLVFALGAARSFLWLVSDEIFEVHLLPPRRVIESLAQEFAKQIPKKNLRSTRARQAIGHELGELLLGPVWERLSRGRLIVVPHGALFKIPFVALPHPAEGSRLLVETHEVVVLPSISTLISLREAAAERTPPPRDVAAFVDPVFRADDQRVETVEGPRDLHPGTLVMGAAQEREIGRLGDRLGIDPYQRLYHSRAEGEAIREVAPEGEHFLATDFTASHETFVSSDLETYRILHFATHALQDWEHPELSSLLLSLVGPEGEPRNGFLRAFEISKLRLPAELVVLSACETGLGKTFAGDGPLGLTRAFFDAGATRVISSLWQVNDLSTARLMSHFYAAHLRDGLAPAAALRQAQLRLLADPETAAPYHWAAFIFQGEWLPVESQRHLTHNN